MKNCAVKLVGAAAPVLRQIADEAVEIRVRVPLDAFAESWKRLSKHMMDSPEYQMMMEEGEALSEEELRMLCAVLWAAYRELPMGDYEHLHWVAEEDETRASGQYTGWFVGEYLSKNPEHGLWEMSDSALDALSAAVENVKAANAARRAKLEAQLAEREARRAAKEAKKLAKAKARTRDVLSI